MTVAAAGVCVTPNVVLERRLGAGGMGTVWLAQHLGLRKKVVVKLMSDHVVADEGFRQRFAQEAAAGANVKSPYVVDVFDAGFSDELGPYIVMEALEGEDLSVRLARQPVLPGADVVRLVAHAAHALDRAHASGIVHRDIKPGNLFLCPESGAPFLLKILDFGVAQWRTEAPLTAVGVAVGTPTYMSPEQALGQEVDGRSDLYSLALVAFRALTGSTALSRASLDALGPGVYNLPPPKLTERRPELPSEVDAWFARAAARDRSARFPSGATMAEELALALALDAATTNATSAAEDKAVASPEPMRDDDGAPRTGGVTVARPAAAVVEPEHPTTSAAVARVPPSPAAAAPRSAGRSWGKALLALTALAALAAGGRLLYAPYNGAPKDLATSAMPSAPAASALAPAPIPIGVLLDLSGEGRLAGRALLDATTAAVKAVNDRGGVRGRPLRLVVSDDQGDRGAFLEERARALVATAGLKVVLGPIQSDQVAVVAPITQAAGVMELTGSATSATLSTLQRPEERLLFRTVPSQTRVAEALARVMRGEPLRPLGSASPDAASSDGPTRSTKCMRVAVLAPNDAFGPPFVEAFIPAFKALGGSTAEATFVSPVAQTTYAKELGDLSRAHIDCQVLALSPKVAARYLLEARAEGLPAMDPRRLPTFGVAHLASDDFIEHAREVPRDPASASAAEGVRGVRPATRSTARPESAELTFLLGAVDAGAGAYDAPFVASQFDAAILAALTLETAGPDADAASLRRSLFAITRGEQVFGPHELPQLLAAIRRGVSVNYVGASGALMFDQNGDVEVNLVAWVVKDGKVHETGRLAPAPTLKR